MPTPGYVVEALPREGRINMTFVGFWDAATVDAFGAELQAAMTRLAGGGVPPGDYVYQADFRQCPVQSSAMVERFKGFAATAGVRAKRIAVLNVTVLQKKQTQRMAEGFDHYRFFLPDQVAEAGEWLRNG